MEGLLVSIVALLIILAVIFYGGGALGIPQPLLVIIGLVVLLAWLGYSGHRGHWFGSVEHEPPVMMAGD